jgi:hypothetical protein
VSVGVCAAAGAAKPRASRAVMRKGANFIRQLRI